MKRIILEVTRCETESAFNGAAAVALGAPDWHGRNLDAWWDSIRSDDINEVRAPYELTIRGAGSIPAALFDYVQRFAALFEIARMEGDLQVRCIVED